MIHPRCHSCEVADPGFKPRTVVFRAHIPAVVRRRGEGRELGRPWCSASTMSWASLSDVLATWRVGWGSPAPDPTPGIVCCRSCP